MAVEQRILSQLESVVACDESWASLECLVRDATRGVHLAVMVEPFLTYILDGRKTIESRFSKNLIAPYGRVQPGDLVLLKRTAGPVVATFESASVECVALDSDQALRLRHNFSDAICADDSFWEDRSDKRFATLIGIRDVRLHGPLLVDKADRRGWIVLREAADHSQMSLL